MDHILTEVDLAFGNLAAHLLQELGITRAIIIKDDETLHPDALLERRVPVSSGSRSGPSDKPVAL